jgi:putative DNA primase/helicase
MGVFYASLASDIDPNWDESERNRWLFSEKTIDRSVKLKLNEVELLAQDLLANNFKKIEVNKWGKIVREQKKKVLSHIDICNIFIDGSKELKQKPAKNRVMFARSSWHTYKDGVWLECEDWIIELELQSLLESIEKSMGFQYTAGSHRSILTFIQQKLYVPTDQLDSNNDWINVKNGVYDLKTEKLLPHSPDHKLTRQMNVIFNPMAQSDVWGNFKKQVIGFYNIMNEWEPDEEAIRFLDEVIGYSFTTSVQHEIMIWCLGEGRNGKGVLFHAIKSIAGSSAMDINLNTLERNAYQLAMIGGKTVLLCTEADKKVDIANDGTIKAIVSGEGVMVRQIRERPFVLESKAKIWWSFNNPPNVKDTSEGFWRRVKVIPFHRNFDEDSADKDLKSKITDEHVKSVIFNDAILAYNRVKREGSFTQSRLVTDRTSEYKEEENVVQSFVRDCCDLKKGEKVPSNTLYSEYRDWCNRSGYHPFSIKNFKAEMKRLKIHNKRLSAGVVYLDIKVKDAITKAKVWN